MNIKNNLRYKVHSEKIENAFLSLLETHKYDDITISQICKRANINRSTFYCHYTDINDLIIKVEKKFAKATAGIFNFGERSSHEAMVEMFTFVRDNKHFYKAFLNIPYTTFAETNIKSEVLENIGKNSQIDKSKTMAIYYRASFFGAGIKEMCRLWLENDCQETPEQMASLLLEEYKNRDC